MAAGALVTIYCLKDPSTGVVRYVGKANDLQARMRTHQWEAKQLQTHKARWLRSLKCAPTCEVLEVVQHSSWEERERFWIAKFRSDGINLTNFADGGQTSPVEGKGHTLEARAKMRAAALQLGIKPPSRNGMSPWNKGTNGVMRPNRTSFVPGRVPWNKGKTMSPEYIEKNRHGHLGKPWSPARRAAQERRSLSAIGG